MNAAYKREYTSPHSGLTAGIEFILQDGETLSETREERIKELLQHWQCGYAVQQPLWIQSWSFWGARSVGSGNQ